MSVFRGGIIFLFNFEETSTGDSSSRHNYDLEQHDRPALNGIIITGLFAGRTSCHLDLESVFAEQKVGACGNSVCFFWGGLGATRLLSVITLFFYKILGRQLSVNYGIVKSRLSVRLLCNERSTRDLAV